MDNSHLDTNNNLCSNKKSTKNFCVKNLSIENVIKNSSADIVFNNQTDKLIKSDINKQLNPVMGKYNLRKKSVKTKSDVKSKHQELKNLRASIEDKKPKKRNSQLSKYKRKNANARERSRVQEINAAFEILKGKLPSDIFHKKMDNKVTKIACLRYAVNYISILTKILKNQKSDSSSQSTNQLDQSNHLMDSLPDISFISSAELSSLSGLESDEELSNQPELNVEGSTNNHHHHLNSNTQINRTVECLDNNQINNQRSPSVSVFNIDASESNEERIRVCENSGVYSHRSDERRLVDAIDERKNQGTDNLFSKVKHDSLSNRKMVSDNNQSNNFDNESTLIELNQSNNFIEYVPPSQSPAVHTPILNHHHINHSNNHRANHSANHPANQTLVQTPTLNHHHVNNQTITLHSTNQTVTLQPTNLFSQQQPTKLNLNTTTPVFGANLLHRQQLSSVDSGFKLSNETVVLQNSNQLINRPRLNPFSASTPLVNRSYDDLSTVLNQSNCFSPIIKNDDCIQSPNYLSIKSLQNFADDSLLFSFNEDIENEGSLFSINSDDDFGIVL